MNCYQILEIEKTATNEEIRKAYKKLALKWHPDKNLDNIEEAENKFKEISSAYDKISTPDKRKLYDHPPSRNVILNFNQAPIFNLMRQMQNTHLRNIPQRQGTRVIKIIRIVNGVMKQETIVIEN